MHHRLNKKDVQYEMVISIQSNKGVRMYSFFNFSVEYTVTTIANFLLVMDVDILNPLGEPQVFS